MATFEQELESLNELEGEFEGEGFLGNIIGGLFQEGEGEGFLEGEGESELEQEQFIGALLRSPALRKVGSAAARAALSALTESEMEGEGFLEGEGELEGEGFLGGIGNIIGGLFQEGEGEGFLEGEGVLESEFELNPIRRIYPDAMMEHMAHAAAEAANEQEAAEQFFPLIGMAAAKLLPLAAKALPKVIKMAPKLTRGISNVTRTLFRNRRTRPLVRAMPTIAQRTVNTLAKQAMRGRPVTPTAAIRTLAAQTNRVLGSPQQCQHALRRSRILDQQAHRITGVRAPRRSAVTRCPTCGNVVRRASRG